LRFLLELFGLGALGYRGFKSGGGPVAKVGLGIGAPLVAAVVWGVFLSPRTAVPLPGFLVLMLQAVVFRATAADLVATGHRTLALVFGTIVMINAFLMYAWGQ